jgi:hypothetical protein
MVPGLCGGTRIRVFAPFVALTQKIRHAIDENLQVVAIKKPLPARTVLMKMFVNLRFILTETSG